VADAETRLVVAHPHEVELRIPADSAYVSVLRTATAGVAARLDFTVDDIDDLRMAVDEACGLLLPQAAADSGLICSFLLESGHLTVSVTVQSAHPQLPDRDGFPWAILCAVAGTVDATTGPDGTTTITIQRWRVSRA
jgi:serine/threonine-protein kinase RsbW